MSHDLRHSVANENRPHRQSAWLFGLACLVVFGIAVACATTRSDQSELVVFVVENSAQLRSGSGREGFQANIKTYLDAFPKNRFESELILFGSYAERIVPATVPQITGKSQFADCTAGLGMAVNVVKAQPQRVKRVILITSGKQTVNTTEWLNLNQPGMEQVTPKPSSETQVPEIARQFAVELCDQLHCPLYIVAIGPSQDSGWLRDLVQAANGNIAASRILELAVVQLPFRSHLFQQYLYSIEGTNSPKQAKQVEGYFKQLARPVSSSPDIGLGVFGGTVALLVLVHSLRTFPGPGDIEYFEVIEGTPLYLATGIESALALQNNQMVAFSNSVQVCRGTEMASLGVMYRTRNVHVLGYLQCSDYDRLVGLTKQLVLLDPRRIGEGLFMAAKGHPEDPDTMKAVKLRLACQSPDTDRIQKTLQLVSKTGIAPGEDLVYTKLCLAFHPELAEELGPRQALFWILPHTGEETEAQIGDQIYIGHLQLTLESIRSLDDGYPLKAGICLKYSRPASGITPKRWMPVRLQTALRLRGARHHVLHTFTET